MREFPTLPRRQIGLAWLIWLALLLPMAQAAAAWHAYSHAAADAVGRADGKPAPHAAHCDLCLAAAVVGGSALVDQHPPRPTPDARHEQPEPAGSRVWTALPTTAYQSRAPPPVPR